MSAPYQYRKRALQAMSTQPMKRRATTGRRRRSYAAAMPRTMSVAMRTVGRTSLTEVKSYDVQLCAAGGQLPLLAAAAGAEPAAVWAGLTEVNCVRQDATVAGRIGNKIVMRSIHVRFSVNINAAANYGCARFMLVYDRQPNGAFPAITDILLDQPAGVARDFGGVNIANKSRWLVLRDQVKLFDQAQTVMHFMNWYCKCRLEVEFGGNAGTIADFRTGAVYLVAFYNFVSAGNIAMYLPTCRVRFYD